MTLKCILCKCVRFFFSNTSRPRSTASQCDSWSKVVNQAPQVVTEWDRRVLITKLDVKPLLEIATAFPAFYVETGLDRIPLSLSFSQQSSSHAPLGWVCGTQSSLVLMMLNQLPSEGSCFNSWLDVFLCGLGCSRVLAGSSPLPDPQAKEKARCKS